MKEIGFFFDTVFTYIEQYIQLIANYIVTADKYDDDTITNILISFKSKVGRVESLIGMELFDFITPDGRVVADVGSGKIKTSLYVKKNERQYMELAPKEPWKLHICLPDIEITRESKYRTLPFGFGITDLNGKFFGIISGGITVYKLKKKLSEVIQNEHYSFIVLNNDLDYILYSGEEGKIEEDKKREIKSKLEYLKSKKEKFGTLNETMFIDGTEYIFYTKANDYPFIIIIGIKRKDIFNLRDLEKKMIELEKEGNYHQMFLFALLYMFQDKIINPIVGERAHHSNFEIPKVFSTKVNDLFLALEQMEGFMEIKIQKEVAEETKKARERFFRMVLHDLKNPTGIIDNVLELVKNDGIETEEAFEMMKSAVTKIMNIVNSLQFIAKIESNTLSLHKTNIDLSELIENVIKVFQFDINAKNLYLNKQIETDNLVISADRQLILRILTNLVFNAIKFTSEGGITIIVRDEGDEKVIIVRDTGCGIREEIISEILTGKDNLEGSEYMKEEDSLLFGLSVIRKFVERHEGELDIQSELGKGTEVVMRFKRN